jgi:hypothetical protein
MIYSEALPRDTDTSGYTHSSLVANLAPSDSACNYAHASCGWMRPPNPQSVPAITFSHSTILA